MHKSGEKYKKDFATFHVHKSTVQSLLDCLPRSTCPGKSYNQSDILPTSYWLIGTGSRVPESGLYGIVTFFFLLLKKITTWLQGTGYLVGVCLKISD